MIFQLITGATAFKAFCAPIRIGPGFAVCLLTSSLLGGCSLLTPETEPVLSERINWLEHRRELNQLQQWRLTGKIGIRQADDGGSAYLDWYQNEDSFYIRLNGPLGIGTTLLKGNPSGAQLTMNNQDFIAESPEALLYGHTGWQIPLNNLLYWIKGLPAPDEPAETRFNLSGYLQQLHQSGWQLVFQRYTHEPELNVTLPHKISLQHENTRIKLVIRRWQPYDSGP